MEENGNIVCKISHTFQGKRRKFDLSLDLTLDKGEILAISGESGAGKTSLIRILAGLLQPKTGYLEVFGKVWLDTQNKLFLPPQKRSVGMVFQDYALFPHLSVLDNLYFALPREEEKSWPEALLKTVDMWELRNEMPNGLSGGQQQRVAILRALVQKPDILLLDEPLSALDDELRHNLQQDILRFKQELGMTCFWISHNIMEIAIVADRVALLKGGKIEKMGTPADLFMPHPAELWEAKVLKKLNPEEYWIQVGNTPYRVKLSGDWIAGDKIHIKPQILLPDHLNNS